MSAGVRVPLEEAMGPAIGLARLLSGATERIRVAGSIRRGRPDVGDIELVAVPLISEAPDGMFGTTRVNHLTEVVDDLIGLGDLARHPDDPKRGDRYSKVIHAATGLQVDLFSATAQTFGLIFLIRTGPADYSHRFVTDLRKRGLHVAGGELHRGGMGCGSYVCEVVPTPEERDVYAAAGWPYVRPEIRGT